MGKMTEAERVAWERFKVAIEAAKERYTKAFYRAARKLTEVLDECKGK